ncbi:MAG: response regulator [Ruminiclostridium sp.]|nr:response regulator [Ruminiclostridium sp.]
MKTVLIADDAQFMRLCLRQILEKRGFQVVAEAANGHEAIAKYRLHNPDIVTMDITMPDMDGIAAVKELKKIDPEAKIIVISAMGSMTFIYDAISAGASGFIVKPFKEEDVIKNLIKL